MSKTATGKIEHFVSIVTDNNYMDFIQREKDDVKIILFTNKKAIPPLYKVLSKFSKKATFGIVKNDEEFTKKFNIQSLPALCVVTSIYEYKLD
mmetsp:Transcript_11627/g.13204  ORF Transcript_11627/g.13204 Transcript_11627/m.13204 type:complete len:93 (-) Transcript_11627:423-701(-)